MPDQRVVLVDSSILHCLVGLEGDDRAQEIADELADRSARHEVLVIPVTAIIEVGNQIEQVGRRDLAQRLVVIIERALDDDPPWRVQAITWDQSLLRELIRGNSTGSDLLSLLGDGRLGTGDVAILIERDRMKTETAFTQFEIWTLDNELRAHSG